MSFIDLQPLIYSQNLFSFSHSNWPNFGCLWPLKISQFFFDMALLTFERTRCPRPALYIPCFKPGVSHFSQKPWLLKCRMVLESILPLGFSLLLEYCWVFFFGSFNGPHETIYSFNSWLCIDQIQIQLYKILLNYLNFYFHLISLTPKILASNNINLTALLLHHCFKIKI